MKNYYSIKFRGMVRAFFALFLIGATTVLWAQTPPYYNSNSGTSCNSFPLNSTTNKVQWIYDAGMFNSNGTSGTPAFSGLITKVYIRFCNIANGGNNYSNLTIKLDQNVGTQTSWNSTVWHTGMTTVFTQNSFQFTGSSTYTWYEITLQTPFVYDPAKSLAMEISTSGGTGHTVAQITNNGTRRVWGPSAGATPSGRGTGLADFGFDLVPLNVEVTSLSHPSTICEKQSSTVEVTIENTDITPQSNFLVEYRIDGVVKATEQYTNTIPAGQSANYVFNTPIDNDVPGTYTLSANILGKNTSQSMNYTVMPSPTGSTIGAGSTFIGTLNSGDPNDPDIVANGDEIQYSLDPPTGFNNNGFGTTWTFDYWEMKTAAGNAPSAGYTQNNPSGGNNAMSSFTPTTASTDSTYTVRYAITDLGNGCTAPEIERTLFVAPRPVASFTSTPACDKSPVQFKNNTTISSGSVTYIWRFGDGDSSVKVNPSHVYPGPGTYTVELVAVSNYNYEDVATGSVTVFENPTAEFSHTNVCEGGTNAFQDGSIIPAGNPTYVWNFGDGSAMGSGNAPTHQYATPGVYEVTMRVTANGCSGTAKNFVTYAPRAVVDFTDNGVTCNNELVSFNNASTLAFGSMGYNWDFNNDGSIESTTKNPSHNFSGFGTMSVKLKIVTNLGCKDSLVKQITLKEGPVADFTSTGLCSRDNVDFTNTSVEPAGSTTGYAWTFSDGTSFTGKDVSKSFSTIGAFTVTLTATSTNGCQDVLTRTISVDEDPTAQFYADDVCEGNDVRFRNASSGNAGNFTFAWDLDGDGNPDNTNKDFQSTLAVGSHDVTLTITTPSGCEDMITKTVVVNEKPVISLNVTTAQKGDGTVAVTATGTPNTNLVVFMGDGGRLTGSTDGSGSYADVYTYGIDGLYDVKVNATKVGCTTVGNAKASVYRTGVMDITAAGLKAYPNPTNGKFVIDFNGMDVKSANVEIYASNGQVFQAIQAVSLINGKAHLDLTAAPAGVYLVKVTTNSGVYTTRMTLNN